MRLRLALILLWSMLGLLLPAPQAHADQVPQAFNRYRIMVQTEAFRLLGPRAPVARIAAQFHQESRYDPAARSGVGAAGLGQFMPPTAADMGRNYPTECAPVDPLSAAWAIRCAIIYDRALVGAVRPLVAVSPPGLTGPGAAGIAPLSECTRWAFGLSSYNGGGGWLALDRALAQRSGSDPNTWAGVVPYSKRSPAALRENRGYITRIMGDLEPLYIAAGMPGTLCTPGSF